MHAIRQYEFGPAEKLLYEEVPDPEPGRGQVRIAVEAAGVHLIDTVIRAGERGGPFPLPALPMTPGREVAGTVDALGPGTAPEWAGRHVVAHLGQANGGYAGMAVAAAEVLHEIPGGLSAPAAVTMIGTGRTAVGVLDTAALTAGDVVLVTSAAGGMGSLLVQAARAAGATAVGLAGGPRKVDLVRGLGADVAVDYRDPGWPDVVRSELAGARPTVVLDGVGGDVGRGALELLDPGGRLVMFGWASGSVTAFDSSDVVGRGLTVSWAIGPRLMRRPGGLRPLESRALAAAAGGSLVPLVGEPFTLADAAAAHTALERRETVGKVVLTP